MKNPFDKKAKDSTASQTKQVAGQKKLPKLTIARGNRIHIRKGSYALLFGAVTLAIVVVVNLLVMKIPSQYRSVDVSDSDVTGISDTTKTLVSGLKDDVTIYLLAQSGQEDSTLQKMLEHYSDLSSHIKVKTVDPVQHPNFAKDYTSDSLDNNSLIVVGPNRNKVIANSSIYETSIDYQTYQEQTTGFDGEGQLTAAISYVTSDNMPTVYTLTGHSETAMTSSMTTALSKDNITTADLSLLTAGAVPDDASAVIVNAPQTDLSSDEADELIAYLKKGGKLFMVTNYSTTAMPNLQKVLNEYGISTMDGVVVDVGADHYANRNPLYLVPTIGTAEALGDLANGGYYVLMPVAQGIKTLDTKRDTVTVSSLLSSSSDSYIKTDVNSSLEKADGDAAGPFDLGVVVTETVSGTASSDSSAASSDASSDTAVSSDTAASTDTAESADTAASTAAAATSESAETRIVYLTSENLFNDQVDSMVSGSNMKLLANTMNWLVGSSSDVSVSIPSKSLSVTYLTVTEAAVRTWGFLTVILLPIAFLVFGGVLVYRRSKA